MHLFVVVFDVWHVKHIRSFVSDARWKPKPYCAPPQLGGIHLSSEMCNRQQQCCSLTTHMQQIVICAHMSVCVCVHTFDQSCKYVVEQHCHICLLQYRKEKNEINNNNVPPAPDEHATFEICICYLNNVADIQRHNVDVNNWLGNCTEQFRAQHATATHTHTLAHFMACGV